MGYYISVFGNLKCDPPISDSDRELFNSSSRSVLDSQNKYGGHWLISEGGEFIEWKDDIGKSYPDPQTLQALMSLLSQGHNIDGSVEYYGDNEEDTGHIEVKNNQESHDGSFMRSFPTRDWTEKQLRYQEEVRRVAKNLMANKSELHQVSHELGIKADYVAKFLRPDGGGLDLNIKAIIAGRLKEYCEVRLWRNALQA